MTSTTPQSQSLGRRTDQQLLFECGEPTAHFGKINPSPNARGQRKRPTNQHDEVLAAIREVAEQLSQRLADLEAVVQIIVSQSAATSPAKEFYTTKEVAVILGKRPYTVREWCRLGRVNGEKAEFGRGLDDEWRISHDELMRIQNEGLLSVQKFARVAPPKRVAK